MAWLDYALLSQDDASMDNALQFVNIAWPAMIGQHAHGIRADVAEWLSEPPAVDGQEVSSEQFDIIAPEAQWREFQNDDTDSVIEVLAKFVALDQCRDCFPGGKNGTCI